jgi:ATP synthase protein I
MWRQAGTTGAVGVEISLAIVIGYIGGRYLDGWLNTTPWLSWIGFGAGVGASAKALIRVVRDYRRQEAVDAQDTATPPEAP